MFRSVQIGSGSNNFDVNVFKLLVWIYVPRFCKQNP